MPTMIRLAAIWATASVAVYESDSRAHTTRWRSRPSRDGNATFEPGLVCKGQTRLSKFEKLHVSHSHPNSIIWGSPQMTLLQLLSCYLIRHLLDLPSQI